MINLASFDGTEYGLNWKRTILRDDNEQHMTIVIILGGFFYAKKQISGCSIHNYYGNYYGLWNGCL